MIQVLIIFGLILMITGAIGRGPTSDIIWQTGIIVTMMGWYTQLLIEEIRKL